MPRLEVAQRFHHDLLQVSVVSQIHTFLIHISGWLNAGALKGEYECHGG